ncbi:MAG: hypothetical protein AAGF11_00165 [Myxococcota bacterium]
MSEPTEGKGLPECGDQIREQLDRLHNEIAQLIEEEERTLDEARKAQLRWTEETQEQAPARDLFGEADMLLDRLDTLLLAG